MSLDKCFLCDVKGKPVLPFNDSLLENVLNMLHFRQTKKFKYNDVKLSREIAENVGYHPECKAKCMVLKKNYKDEFDDIFKMDVEPSTSADGGKKNEQAEDISRVHEKASTSQDFSEEGALDETCMDVSSGKATPEDEKSSGNTFTHCSSSAMTHVSQQGQFTASTPIPADKNTAPSPNISAFSDGIGERAEEPLAPQPTNDGDDKGSKCIFCGAVQKRSGARRINVRSCNSQSTIENIRKIALVFDDTELLDRLGNLDTIFYHPVCYSLFQTKYTRQLSQNCDSKSVWHNLRNVHKAAFEALSAFIHVEIIENERMFLLTDLFSRYHALLLEMSNAQFCKNDFQNYKAEHLQNKILREFGVVLTVESSPTYARQKVVYKHEVDVSKLVNSTLIKQNAEETKLQDVAYSVRNSVKAISKRKLPEKLRVSDIIDGECDIPVDLFNLISNLIQGPDMRRQKSDDDLIRINSICSDIIYAVTKGRIKPSKQLTLGLAIKSLTSSRKVLTVLNKYGHTVGYSLAEELETELAFTAHEENQLIPPGIHVTDGLSTHLAFDNFDRFVDTFTGKDTLHDTVGIIYQFSPKADDTMPLAVACQSTMQTSSDDDNVTAKNKARKRRKFEEIPRVMQPYFKRRATMSLLPSDIVLETVGNCKISRESAITRDILWVFSLSHLDKVPMWTGYNSSVIVDCSEMQNIDYMPPINSSPTSYNVVYETLKMSKEVADQCQQEQIVVTYDLAIAKMAMQIQSLESPKFDRLFVNLGGFHMQLAFFKAVGKFIDGCGIVDILTESEVLAAGSVNGFIESKHFNRCKRIHPILAGALEMSHFDIFMSESVISSASFVSDLKDVLDLPVESHEPLILSPALEEVILKYKHFCSLTLTGHHGKTAQFYLQYVELINIFFRFSRSIRTSDFELYMDSIFEMANMFFALNQPNYARWSLKYLSNLVSLKVDDSPLLNEFKRGAFGVKRTGKSLARSPVDLTLEQTVNAEAANSLTGINHFTNSITARQRWAFSHTLRTKIISHLLENVGMSQKDDVSHHLENKRIEKDTKALNAIRTILKQNMNPFDQTVDKDSLFNIATGKAVSPKISDFLINASAMGHQQKLQFLEECAISPDRFEKPIKRNTILNFASYCLKKLQKSVDGSKEVLIKMERNVFGRLLAIALDKKVDMEVCFSYPLAPAPPALVQCNGDMHKTPKAALAKHLTANVNPSKPPKKDIEIIDGFYFLNLLGSSVPQTFGKIAEHVLRKICGTDASEIHLIFDRYLSPSIKDVERHNRQEVDIPFAIVGPSQKRQTDFNKSLKNFRFKEALVQFFSQHWEDNSMTPFIQNKTVFITVQERCYSYRSVNGRISKKEEADFECQHEEADTRILFHMNKSNPNSTILVRASDTDVLVILLGNIHKFPHLNIFLASSFSQKEDLKCYSMNDVAASVGLHVCRALPAFHAFTGCDYTAAFFRKGKVRPFKLLQKNDKFVFAFASLNDVTDIFDDEKIELIQEFTSLMYGVKNCCSVNSARLQLFEKLFSRNGKNEHFMEKVKGLDSSLIPPCWRTLKQKILRTVYATAMWQNANDAICTTLNVEECGWALNQRLEPVWFEGEPTPLNVDDVLHFNESNDVDDDLNDLHNVSTDSDDE